MTVAVSPDFGMETDVNLAHASLQGQNQLRSRLVRILMVYEPHYSHSRNRGNGFAAHLDATAYDHIRKIEHVTANLAVDSATLEKGCLEVVLGSHKMDTSFLRGGQIHPDWEASHQWLSVPLEPGKPSHQLWLTRILTLFRQHHVLQIAPCTSL